MSEGVEHIHELAEMSLQALKDGHYGDLFLHMQKRSSEIETMQRQSALLSPSDLQRMKEDTVLLESKIREHVDSVQAKLTGELSTMSVRLAYAKFMRPHQPANTEQNEV